VVVARTPLTHAFDLQLVAAAVVSKLLFHIGSRIRTKNPHELTIPTNLLMIANHAETGTDLPTP
jgi:hypothetical protein